MSTEQPWVEGSPPPESRSLEEWRALASEVETAQDSALDVLMLQHLSAVVFPSANAHRRADLVAHVPATTKRLLLTSFCARMAEKLETAHLGWDGLEDTLPRDDPTEGLRSRGQEFGIRTANRERPKGPGEPGGDGRRTIARCQADDRWFGWTRSRREPPDGADKRWRIGPLARASDPRTSS